MLTYLPELNILIDFKIKTVISVSFQRHVHRIKALLIKMINLSILATMTCYEFGFVSCWLKYSSATTRFVLSVGLA